MIIFKVTNIINDKVYINHKLSLPVVLFRIKNKALQKDLLKFNSENFTIDILFETNDKEKILLEYKKYIEEYSKINKDLLYNSIQKDKIVVKDENGKNIKISVYDERYTTGKLKHVSTGKIPVININTNKTTSVYANDPLYNIRYIPITKGKVITKDASCNNFFVDKTDPCYLNGELKFVLNDKEISKKAAKSKIKTYISKRSFLYNEFDFPIEHDNISRTYIIKNYCKHGDLTITPKIFKALYKNKDNFLCNQCRKEFYDNYVSTQEELTYFQNLYKSNDTDLYVESYVETYLQKLYFYITNFTKHLDIPWNQRVYLFKHNLTEIPKCNYEGCSANATYNYGSKFYNMYCKEHGHAYVRSKGEIDILDFIKEIYSREVSINCRNIIGMELDIFIPDKNIAIEFNGLYWHSENFKDKEYHYQKWNRCRNRGIKLVTIWEDDWRDKQEIIKSLLRNQLNKVENQIYAKNCHIKVVNSEIAKYFLNSNHIQGYCNSSLNLGLFCKDELVSLMTFKNNQKDNYELLRFCNKLNTNVIDSVYELFNFFKEKYVPYSVISYVSCDHVNDNLFKNLGFKNLGWAGLNCRQINERVKIYGTGNLKYEYVKIKTF